MFASEEDAKAFVNKYSKPYDDGFLEIRETEFVPAGGSYTVDEEAFWWLDQERPDDNKEWLFGDI